MSFFRSITRALSSPLFRGASAVAGVASGFGAFKDMGAIPGLNIRPETAIGALNLAAGASGLAEKRGGTALNLAQIGLGGFNVLQNNQLGNFGGNNMTFQDVAAGRFSGAPTTNPSAILAQGPSAAVLQAADVTGGVPTMQGVEPEPLANQGGGSTSTTNRVAGERIPGPPRLAPRVTGFDPEAYTNAQSRSWVGAATPPAAVDMGAYNAGLPAAIPASAPIANAVNSPLQVMDPTGGVTGDVPWNYTPPAAPTAPQPDPLAALARSAPTGVLPPEAADFNIVGAQTPQAPDMTIRSPEGNSFTSTMRASDTSGTMYSPMEDPNAPAARMGTQELRAQRAVNQPYQSNPEDMGASIPGRSAAPAQNTPAQQAASGPAPGSTPQQKQTWYEKTFDKMVENPLMTVVAGSMLVGLMQDDAGKEAAEEYAKRVAETRAQIDPNSNFAQEYKKNYQLTRQNKLDEEYEKMLADYESKMAARGMLDSTVYTEGLSSIRQNYLRIKSEIPAEANDAYLRYAQGLAGATSATLAPDAQVAAMRTQAGAGSQPNLAAQGMALGRMSK